MADICIIYAHPSKPTVRKLHALLSERYRVWWDEDIHAGNYRTEIERQLAQAKCVVPAWCQSSRASPHVIDEAEVTNGRGVPLLPVRIEDVDPPLGFGSLHTVDLIEWSGEPTHPGAQDLLWRIQRLLGSGLRRLL